MLTRALTRHQVSRPRAQEANTARLPGPSTVLRTSITTEYCRIDGEAAGFNDAICWWSRLSPAEALPYPVAAPITTVNASTARTRNFLK